MNERDLNKIVGHKPKHETEFINLTKIKSQIKELNKELERRISKSQEKDKKENG